MSLMAMATFSGKPDVLRLILIRSNEKLKHESHYHGTLMGVNWRPFIEADGDGEFHSLLFNRGDSGLLQ